MPFSLNAQSLLCRVGEQAGGIGDGLLYIAETICLGADPRRFWVLGIVALTEFSNCGL